MEKTNNGFAETDKFKGLEEKSIVVLGGTGGIGSEVTRMLSASGANVITAGRDKCRLKELCTLPGVESYVLDLEDISSIDRCVELACEKYAKLDGMVNCIGSVFLKPAHLTKDSDWDSVIEINLTSSFKALRASVGAMMREGGSVVLVSSAAAKVGLASHEAIAAAKAGITGLALSAAATYARRGIRVNCVSPGLVQTPLTQSITSSQASKQHSEAMHALGRLGEPQDVAQAICFLLSSRSSWVTGQVFGVDGGLSNVRPK